MTIPPHRRRWFIFIWASFWIATGAVAFSVLLPWFAQRRGERAPLASGSDRNRVRAAFAGLSDGDPHPIHNPEQFVWDERCDVRPRSNVSLEFSIEPIGGGEAQSYRVNHIDHGVIRPAPLSSIRSGPRILMLGDSHLYGVTDISSNASAILERKIRRRDDSNAVVINAACMYYSPYQYVLRARSLWNVFKPDVVVAVFFAGNDFVELDDRNRPFISDALIENTPDAAPPNESTSFRRLLFEQIAPEHYQDLFWQGMNQAIYLARKPAHREILLAKAVKAIELLQAECEPSHAPLIVVIIPSYGDYMDYDLPITGALADTIVRQKVNRSLRHQLVDALRKKSVRVVDMHPSFRASRLPNIYAGDFHIWDAGHQLLAVALIEPVIDALHKGAEADD